MDLQQQLDALKRKHDVLQQVPPLLTLGIVLSS